jgi:hypothetical protein
LCDYFSGRRQSWDGINGRVRVVVCIPLNHHLVVVVIIIYHHHHHHGPSSINGRANRKERKERKAKKKRCRCVWLWLLLLSLCQLSLQLYLYIFLHYYFSITLALRRPSLLHCPTPGRASLELYRHEQNVINGAVLAHAQTAHEQANHWSCCAAFATGDAGVVDVVDSLAVATYRLPVFVVEHDKDFQ